MVQFYLLSVLMNVLAGIVFIFATDFISQDSGASKIRRSGLDSDFDDFDFSSEDSAEPSDSLFKSSFLDDMTFRLVLGVLSLLMGMIKLMSSMGGDQAVVGDFFPAFSGLIAGIFLLVEWFFVRQEGDFILPDVLERIMTEGRKFTGWFCIAAGLLHFIFPRVPLL